MKLRYQRGFGNSFCTLEPDTVYNYLVTAHWSPDSAYTLRNQTVLTQQATP